MDIQENIKKRIIKVAHEGRLSCEEAFNLAQELDCKASEIGQACDDLKIKIIKCRLGCF